VKREDHHSQATLEAEFRADDELDAAQLLDRRMRAHHAGERAFIGDGERFVAELLRLRHELLGMRGAAQETEVAQTMQLGVGGMSLDVHPKIPCRNHFRAPAHSPVHSR
jgi:hypothetical protein